jgi:hypothetical protein
VVPLGHATSAAESSQLFAFGASACLEKDTQARDIRNAIHLASRGLQLLPIRAPAADHTPNGLLTPREGEVLALLRQGRSNAQIALSLTLWGRDGSHPRAQHLPQARRALQRALLELPAAAPAVLVAPTDRHRHGASRRLHGVSLLAAYEPGRLTLKSLVRRVDTFRTPEQAFRLRHPRREAGPQSHGTPPEFAGLPQSLSRPPRGARPVPS